MKTAREIPVEVVGKEDAKKPLVPGHDPFVEIAARLMDTIFKLPGTRLRFGVDTLLDLIPGFGDAGNAVISVLLILRSARHGVPKIVLAHMGLNVLVNSVFGAIPVFGEIASFWFKPNVRNFALLQKHAGRGRISTKSDWLFVILLLGGVLGIALLLAVLVVVVLVKIFGALGSSAAPIAR